MTLYFMMQLAMLAFAIYRYVSWKRQKKAAAIAAANKRSATDAGHLD